MVTFTCKSSYMDKCVIIITPVRVFALNDIQLLGYTQEPEIVSINDFINVLRIYFDLYMLHNDFVYEPHIPVLTVGTSHSL